MRSPPIVLPRRGTIYDDPPFPATSRQVMFDTDRGILAEASGTLRVES